MSASVQQPPSIPPRPSRSQEKASLPMVPPRPANRRLERSMSPNHDRFAPSPLNDTLLSKSPRTAHFGSNGNGNHNGDRSKSVEIPSVVGEEGLEYASLVDEASSPEHTRTVGDLKLHAPKPSLPAVSAKQRVMTVTRTDSDRAASFGIGKASSNDDAVPSNRSLKKKASTTSQLSNTESHIDDEQGIPEIGQQVPMYPNAGDVQAPSPAPSAAEGKRHHNRKTSSRGIPPGSYGLHGHGLGGQDKLDKLDKAYYEKHPEALNKEKIKHHHDRANDFSMSKDDLEKIVRETASRGSGLAVKNYAGTPSEQVAWQALEETASRVASPRPSSTDGKTSSNPRLTVSDTDKESAGVIHIDGRRSSTRTESPSEPEEEPSYTAPILADDEVAKDPSPYAHQPAVEPGPERRGSAFEMDESISRPTSRPASLYKEPSYEVHSTPLEDVEEYEPLFNDDEKEVKKSIVEEKPKKEKKQRFPSADVWEDAPSSVHYTAEVSTPDVPEEEEKPTAVSTTPPKEDETPAQAFARRQEELAEKEAREGGPECFLPGRKKEKPSWVQHQAHLTSEPAARPQMAQRFPSRDVWEDTPDSLKLETTVSTEQEDEPSESSEPPKPESPEVPSRPTIPDRRPKPRQGSGDDKPAIPDRPKPQIPTRPAKVAPSSGGLEPTEAAAPPKQKPAVPARPMGSKIAALQAGFMNDLNQRLRLGPQAPKKEEPAAEESVEEEKEKAPLSDARKGRARGPQRRAPAKSASPAPPVAEPEQPKFVFSQAVTFFEVDPEEGDITTGGKPTADTEIAEESKEESKEEIKEAVEEPKKAEAEPKEVERESKEEPGAEIEKAEETKPEGKTEDTKVEAQTLVTNTAGEPILQEEVKKPAEGCKGLPVEPIATEER